MILLLSSLSISLLKPLIIKYQYSLDYHNKKETTLIMTITIIMTSYIITITSSNGISDLYFLIRGFKQLKNKMNHNFPFESRNVMGGWGGGKEYK